MERRAAATAAAQIVSQSSPPDGLWMPPSAVLLAPPPPRRGRQARRSSILTSSAIARLFGRAFEHPARCERALPTAVPATDLLNSIVASFARFTDRWSDNPLRRFETEEWSDLIGY